MYEICFLSLGLEPLKSFKILGSVKCQHDGTLNRSWPFPINPELAEPKKTVGALPQGVRCKEITQSQ